TRLGTDRQHAVGVQAVQTLACARIVGLRIAGPPIHQIELRIVGTRAPGRTSALRPGVAILWPRLGTWLAGRRNGVSAPQFFSRVWIPAVEESARSGLSTSHARNEHAVGDDLRTGRVVAVLRVREFLVPQLLARLHIER